eukprot:7364682-Prymnesium_polylepis.1
MWEREARLPPNSARMLGVGSSVRIVLFFLFLFFGAVSGVSASPHEPKALLTAGMNRRHFSRGHSPAGQTDRRVDCHIDTASRQRLLFSPQPRILYGKLYTVIGIAIQSTVLPETQAPKLYGKLYSVLRNFHSDTPLTT